MEKNPIALAPTDSPPIGVYVISPSGVVPDDGRFERAIANLARAGYRVRADRAARARKQRFAGSDAQRAGAFARAAAAPEPIVLISRGGYGLTRLLPSLDFAALAAAGKHWVGLSDFTAFHLAMLARAGAVTWAGPALLADFGAETFEAVDETTLGTFDDAMNGRLELLGFRYQGPSGVDVSGTLWGGNLSIVCTLLGTPYFPQVDGGILFLEEVNEHPYRVERMLTQLWLSGVLARQKAIVLGYVNEYRLGDHDGGFDMKTVVKWLAARVEVPILSGLPFGHASPKLTLPHGATVGLATKGRTCWIVLPHEHAAHGPGHRTMGLPCPHCAP
ncbi:MAG: LD-carboxypeptidase [Burkholderiaceae bacterium]